MKTLVKSILGLVVTLCLTSGCDFVGFDEIDKDRTGYAPRSGGGDDEPCRRDCD